MIRTPGVEYTSVSGEKFYVDVLWALAIGSKERLEDILNDPDMKQRQNEICLEAIMKNAYSVAAGLSSHSKKAYPKFVDWYYHSLSPATVPWLLDHPKSNKVIGKVVLLGLNTLLYCRDIKVLTDEGVFAFKNTLISYKDIKYPEKPMEEVREFLENRNYVDKVN
jgi:hypothetical protein